MLTIWNAYTKNLVLVVESATAAESFCARQAKILNFGVYRKWVSGNATFYDCGPKTFMVKKGSTYND